MAEALANALCLPEMKFFSAGSAPTRVNPYAAEVMTELGLSLDNHHSKHVDSLKDQRFDTVITLCEEEYCPSYLGEARRLHWPFEDPGHREGEHATRHSFRQSRDAIHQKLRAYFFGDTHKAETDHAAIAVVRGSVSD